ncbi:MAG TPA: hypothetical protein VEC13_00125, partial [Candidatus Paceibacterota bacterium]|nr:hypothetical protein [Candidatus Paceibacterota bacterium]
LFTSKATDNEKIVCAKDANGDDSIRFSDASEMSVMGMADCLKAGGAPGMQMLALPLAETVSENDTNQLSLAAVSSSFTKTRTTDTRTSIDTTKTDTSSQTSDQVSNQTSNQQTAISSPVIGIIKNSPRNMSSAEMASVNADRGKAGLTPGKFKRGVYECTAFTRDLEKTNPAKYTATVAMCQLKVKCPDPTTGKKRSYLIIGGHMFNDVHNADGSVSYVEPQTGKNIDPDFDGNGKVESNEIYNVPGVVEQVSYLIDKVAPHCTEENTEIVSGPKCTLKSYESVADAYKELGPIFFSPGFNPN